MKFFKARIDAPTKGRLHDDEWGTDGYPRFMMRPGMFLELQDDGTFVPFANDGDISIDNKHKIYYCNSWRESVNINANGTVSLIPLTAQFQCLVDLSPSDVAKGTVLKPGTLISFIEGKFKEADGTYAIGSVKAGRADSTIGGILMIETYGGNYIADELPVIDTDSTVAPAKYCSVKFSWPSGMDKEAIEQSITNSEFPTVVVAWATKPGITEGSPTPASELEAEGYIEIIEDKGLKVMLTEANMDVIENEYNLPSDTMSYVVTIIPTSDLASNEGEIKIKNWEELVFLSVKLGELTINVDLPDSLLHLSHTGDGAITTSTMPSGMKGINTIRSDFSSLPLSVPDFRYTGDMPNGLSVMAVGSGWNGTVFGQDDVIPRPSMYKLYIDASTKSPSEIEELLSNLAYNVYIRSTDYLGMIVLPDMTDTKQGGIWGKYDDKEWEPSELAWLVRSCLNQPEATNHIKFFGWGCQLSDGTGFPAGFMDWWDANTFILPDEDPDEFAIIIPGDTRRKKYEEGTYVVANWTGMPTGTDGEIRSTDELVNEGFIEVIERGDLVAIYNGASKIYNDFDHWLISGNIRGGIIKILKPRDIKKLRTYEVYVGTENTFPEGAHYPQKDLQSGKQPHKPTEP